MDILYQEDSESHSLYLHIYIFVYLKVFITQGSMESE